MAAARAAATLRLPKDCATITQPRCSPIVDGVTPDEAGTIAQAGASVAAHRVGDLVGVGCICGVAALSEQPTCNDRQRIVHRRTLAGSLVGAIREPRQVLDFCAKHDIAADVQVFAIRTPDDAYRKVKNEDVRFRYGIDMASPKREMEAA